MSDPPFSTLIFSVEGEIVSGLKYLQVVKRAGVKGKSTSQRVTTSSSSTVDKTEAMLGSYGPQTQTYEKIVRVSACSANLDLLNLSSLLPRNPHLECSRAQARTSCDRVSSTTMLKCGWTSNGVSILMTTLALGADQDTGFKLGKEW